MSNVNNETKKYKAGDYITIQRPEPYGTSGAGYEWFRILGYEGRIPALKCDLIYYEHDITNFSHVPQKQHLILAAPNVYYRNIKEIDPKEITLKVVYVGEEIKHLRAYTKELLQYYD
jgi:hypothetical protein